MGAQVANAARGFDNLRRMSTSPGKQAFRVARLKAAVTLYGDENALGDKLGWKNGAFVRQMVSGVRAISEKTIEKIEALPDMAGWFQMEDDGPIELSPEERAMVLAFRHRLKQATRYTKINRPTTRPGNARRRNKGQT